MIRAVALALGLMVGLDRRLDVKPQDCGTGEMPRKRDNLCVMEYETVRTQERTSVLPSILTRGLD